MQVGVGGMLRLQRSLSPQRREREPSKFKELHLCCNLDSKCVNTIVKTFVALKLLKEQILFQMLVALKVFVDLFCNYWLLVEREPLRYMLS